MILSDKSPLLGIVLRLRQTAGTRVRHCSRSRSRVMFLSHCCLHKGARLRERRMRAATRRCRPVPAKREDKMRDRRNTWTPGAALAVAMLFGSAPGAYAQDAKTYVMKLSTATIND